MQNVKQAPPFVVVACRAGALQALEHVVAELERFAQILEPERVLGDLVVPEEVRAAAGREHELVVLQRVAVAEPHDLRREVDVHDLAQPDPHVRRPPEDLPERRGDVARAQQAARDLVQERREQVVVLPVHEHDVDRLAGQLPGALEPAEPGPDDHDPRVHASHFPSLAERTPRIPRSEPGRRLLPTD